MENRLRGADIGSGGNGNSGLYHYYARLLFDWLFKQEFVAVLFTAQTVVLTWFIYYIVTVVVPQNIRLVQEGYQKQEAVQTIQLQYQINANAEAISRIIAAMDRDRENDREIFLNLVRELKIIHGQ